jgi:hypothetical protein
MQERDTEQNLVFSSEIKEDQWKTQEYAVDESEIKDVMMFDDGGVIFEL